MMTDFGFHRTGFGEVLPGDADHGAVCVQDQVGRAGLVAELHAQLVGAFDQEIDHHGRAAQLAGHRHRVPARRWTACSQKGHTFSLPV